MKSMARVMAYLPGAFREVRLDGAEHPVDADEEAAKRRAGGIQRIAFLLRDGSRKSSSNRTPRGFRALGLRA